ncbi:hypothetical protein GPJ59_36635 [Streptomyces bambusae]|uniref:Secreted protein n=1 Tax=Streptomyces bambusae TaxID=1550616 RepID=A0ABS6ZHE9_9ACTN|nr:hypothetical protein [Streptomyces bambusae]
MAVGCRPRRRGAAAVVCALLGIALLGGAGASVWADRRAAAQPVSAAEAYRKAASLWHRTPVETLFPSVLDGRGAGPGGADRTWTRVAVAADADCAGALPPDWQPLLAGTGCTRVLRATYTDATRSSLVTVGMVFTPADATAMAALRGRLPLPQGYGFADPQRAAWTVSVLPDAPVVVYAVSAYADGRPVARPRAAEEAMQKDDTSAVAQAGLGHEAKAVADRVERALRALAVPPTQEPTPEPAR